MRKTKYRNQLAGSETFLTDFSTAGTAKTPILQPSHGFPRTCEFFGLVFWPWYNVHRFLRVFVIRHFKHQKHLKLENCFVKAKNLAASRR